MADVIPQKNLGKGLAAQRFFFTQPFFNWFMRNVLSFVV